MSKALREEINLALLYEKVPNRFLLTVAASKRARQLDDGARPLIDASIANNRSLDIALMEIQTGKIIVSVEDLSEEDSILDEISDYLDSDIVNDADTVEPQKDTKKKRKQAV
tara:strand:+ start:3941 stop:4276 length:336 start_codon:yes stop_codon:yes gene_type:complete